MKFRFLILLSLVILCASCTEDVLPKPKAQLRLEYPKNSYQMVVSDCPYSFEISKNSRIEFLYNCSANVHYAGLNATIHLTYRRIDNDLNSVLKEVEKLTFEHAVKADAITYANPFENQFKKVFGKMVNVEGNVASNIQFHVTDSVKNVLFGALYFNVKPNYDSLLPAINYIEKDIRNLMESVAWQHINREQIVSE